MSQQGMVRQKYHAIRIYTIEVYFSSFWRVDIKLTTVAAALRPVFPVYSVALPLRPHLPFPVDKQMWESQKMRMTFCSSFPAATQIQFYQGPVLQISLNFTYLLRDLTSK